MLGQAERLHELKSLFKSNPEESSAKVFAFTSGKGGTGKTFLSLNIAHELAKQGTRVLYADFDFNMANAHLMLDIHPQKTIADYFLSRALLSDIICQYSPNFHLIFGDAGSTGFPDITDNQLNNFISKLREQHNYQVIILDLPAGAGKQVLSSLANSDYSVIVSGTEPTAVMDAYALRKLMKYEGITCSNYVIINKCRSAAEGNTAFGNLNTATSHFLKTESTLLTCIESANEAYEAISAQKTVSELFPGSRLVSQVKAAAHKIYEILQLANIHQPSKKNLQF